MIPLQSIQELEAPPVVGQTYKVPCVEVAVGKNTILVPVLDERPHTDANYFYEKANLPITQISSRLRKLNDAVPQVPAPRDELILDGRA